MNEIVKQILDMSSPVLLLFVLTGFGKVIKMSIIDDRWIPLILTFAGGAAYPFMDGMDARSVFQGLAIGLSAVGANQALRYATGYYEEKPMPTKPPKQSE